MRGCAVSFLHDRDPWVRHGFDLDRKEVDLADIQDLLLAHAREFFASRIQLGKMPEIDELFVRPGGVGHYTFVVYWAWQMADGTRFVSESWAGTIQMKTFFPEMWE